ncbi:MAG: DEAD/DEAH box helicase [Methanomicrobiales archaeon]
MSSLCDYSSIRWEKGHTILTQSTNPTGFSSYDHQDETWRRMDGYFLKNQGGIIWIPTGGGKTVVAAKWLLENAIDEGIKVIWFADRGTLLEQAAETFKGILQKHHALKRKSSLHCGFVISASFGGTSWKKVKHESDIVFASLASSTKYQTEIRSFIGTSSSNKIFIVFDEVQHAYAPTYQRLLKNLKNSSSSVYMIGLSATPYRMTKDESIALWTLFSAYNRSDSSLLPIHRVLQQDLINKKILAVPKFHNYDTLVEPTVEGDRNILDQFNELTHEANVSLAQNESRNDLICNTYIQNYQETSGIDRFEKTLIFTPNILGNYKLYETFQRRLQELGYQNSIKVDYIDSTRSEAARKRIIEKFRKPKHGGSNIDSIDVLINVEMCTEGFDAPLTRTIFLARPTNSEALVRQMMGRAMRGPKVGGNERCHIVRFVDRLPLGYDLVDPPKIYQEEGEREIAFIPVPKEVLKQFNKEIDFLSNEISCIFQYKYDYIPMGWFYFRKIDTQAGDPPEIERYVDVYIMFLKHQEHGYNRLIDEVTKGKKTILQSMEFEELIQHYFFDCKDPLPKEILLRNFIECYPNEENSGTKEIKILFKNRVNLSPDLLYDSHFSSISYSEEIEPTALDRLYDNDSMLIEFYPLKEELEYDIRRYQYYKEINVAHICNELDSEKCRLFIRQNIQNAKRIALPLLYQTLYETYKGLYQNPHEIEVKFIEFEWVHSDTPLGFCRFTNTGVQYHLSKELISLSIPQAALEFILYHLSLHAAIPYEQYGPIFQLREKEFKPTVEAQQEFLNLPIWNIDHPSINEDSWFRVCREYLKLFISERIFEKTNERISEDEVNVEDYL